MTGTDFRNCKLGQWEASQGSMLKKHLYAKEYAYAIMMTVISV